MNELQIQQDQFISQFSFNKKIQVFARHIPINFLLRGNFPRLSYTHQFQKFPLLPCTEDVETEKSKKEVWVEEGGDAVLTCPLQSSRLLWLKNDVQLFSTPKLKIYSNGTLTLRRVDKNDQDWYVCLHHSFSFSFRLIILCEFNLQTSISKIVF